MSRGLYKCEECGHEGKVKEFNVDHIVPVMECPDWNQIVLRFWDEDNLQLLCRACHKVKTKDDRKRIRESQIASRKLEVDDKSGDAK